MTGAVSGSEEYLLQCFNHIFHQRFWIYMDNMEPWLVDNVQLFLCTIHASILSVISQHFLLFFSSLLFVISEDRKITEARLMRKWLRAQRHCLNAAFHNL